MKKAWAYISAFLLGIIGGIVLMYQMVKNNISKTEIKTRSIKQKNTADSTQDISNVINRIKDRTTWLERIKAKKALKRENNNH